MAKKRTRHREDGWETAFRVGETVATRSEAEDDGAPEGGLTVTVAWQSWMGDALTEAPRSHVEAPLS